MHKLLNVCGAKPLFSWEKTLPMSFGRLDAGFSWQDQKNRPLFSPGPGHAAKVLDVAENYFENNCFRTVRFIKITDNAKRIKGGKQWT